MVVASHGVVGGIVTLWNSLYSIGLGHMAGRDVLTHLFKNNETSEQIAITNFYGAQTFDGLKRQ